MIVLKESDRNARNARPSKNTLPGGGYCDYGNMVERLDIRGMPMLVVQKADGKMVNGGRSLPCLQPIRKQVNRSKVFNHTTVKIDLVSSQVGDARYLVVYFYRPK